MNIYYLFGEDTLDEILFPMINFKSHIIANTLDGQKTDFKIKRTKREEEEDGIIYDEVLASLL